MPIERLDDLYNEDGERVCRICNKKLRPLTKNEDWDTRMYHITCFKELVKDIYKFDSIAFKKYGHKKKVGNTPIKEFMDGKKPITISFE